MKKGAEYVDEWGGRCIVLMHSQIRGIVYFMDDLFFVDMLPTEIFKASYLPTGRINKAFSRIFNSNNFKEMQ